MFRRPPVRWELEPATSTCDHPASNARRQPDSRDAWPTAGSVEDSGRLAVDRDDRRGQTNTAGEDKSWTEETPVLILEQAICPYARAYLSRHRLRTRRTERVDRLNRTIEELVLPDDTLPG